jgi:RNA polymerase sigma-70 factor (ECF subfamily)
VQRRAAEIAEPRLLQRQPALAPSTCPDILQLFSQRLEGEINPELCERMQEHVDRCADCQAQCDGLKRTLAVCQAVPMGPVPAHIRDAVHQALRRPGPGS